MAATATWAALDWAAATAAAFAAGLMGAATGGGGGLVVLPALYLLGLTPAEGLANTRLLFFLGALASVVAYARGGKVRWMRLPPLAAGAIVGALAGAWAVPGLPPRVPKILLAAMAVGLVALTRPDVRVRSTRLRVHGRGPEFALLAATGFGVGVVASMIGGGAGMALAALLMGLGWPAVAAVAAAQTTVAVSNFAAFGSYWALGEVDFALSGALAASAMVAAFAGARWLSRLPDEKANRVVRVTLLVVAVVALADAIFGG